MGKTWDQAQVSESLFLYGKRVATITEITPAGVNLRVVLDTGYEIVVPPSGECFAK